MYISSSVATYCKVQLTTSLTDFFVVAQMSVDLVGFVNLVGAGTIEPDIPNLDLVEMD